MSRGRLEGGEEERTLVKDTQCLAQRTKSEERRAEVVRDAYAKRGVEMVEKMVAK